MLVLLRVAKASKEVPCRLLWRSSARGMSGGAATHAHAHSGEEEGTALAGARQRRRWDTRERRREFLLEVGARLGAEGAGWARVRTAQVIAQGGGGLLKRYKGSLAAAVADLLPEQETRGLLAPRKPHGYWREAGRARAFLEQLAADKGVRNPADWAKVSAEDVRKAGGSALLRRHSYSLTALLAAELPELRGSEALLRPKRHSWESAEERREFLEEFAAQRGLSSPADWRSVTVEEVRRAGGQGLLAASGGLAQALQEAFPGSDFSARSCRARVSPKYWESGENRRAFLEEVAKAHGVERPEDWRHVLAEDIEEMGGKALLRRYGTAYALLRATFPELQEVACRDWRPSMPAGYWRDKDNIRAYVEEVGRRFHVSCQEDWYRLSKQQLTQVANPFHAVRWVDALRIALPDMKWDESKVSAKSKRTNQRHLLHTLAAIFPHSSITQTAAPIA